ncbi:odv-ec43 [Clostera anastomosis granulovirus A]|uniref:Odv-ec43 n=1 Tax=Clostera anastomosis granulovirus A TaxID=1986289 RepID=U5KB92_9BBAC|nr:odv-ec43 [Clostera anastomosis granulovirus Henan]AGQ20305.1 odv-ec43 [Clostera anastomosis granulovirus Henan]
MTCHSNVKVYISDTFINFPYDAVVPQVNADGVSVFNHLTVFVSTFADEKVILRSALLNRFTNVSVIKYASNFQEDVTVAQGVVVYWNVIVPIKVFGVGTTQVFNVVLSDNLYTCDEIYVDANITHTLCPLQVDYSVGMVCLKGELAGDSVELSKTASSENTKFIIHFDRETPLGVKILNVKRYLIALSKRTTRATVCVYLPYEELTTVHKELTWEATRRRIRSGVISACNIVDRRSYKYILNALEIVGAATQEISALHRLVNVFTPLILRYHLVPDVFVELNRLTGEEKHVRLYCRNEAVAITNVGPVPLNMPTTSSAPFKHRPLTPPPESLYRELGTRNVFVHPPAYNYFL